jgi:hypothetical protein
MGRPVEASRTWPERRRVRRSMEVEVENEDENEGEVGDVRAQGALLRGSAKTP